MTEYNFLVRISVVLPCLVSLANCGCATTSLNDYPSAITASDIPRELQKVSHPEYRVAPPDLLLIETVSNTRPAEDPVRVNDVLQVSLGNPEPLTGAPPGASPIEEQIRISFEAQAKFLDGEYRVQPDGTLELGPVYGKVKVEGLTLAHVKDAIRSHLKQYATDDKGNPAGISDPQVSVSLPNVEGKQAISGEHLVRPDGTVALGVYGSVLIAGKTLAEVKSAVERHLSKHIHKPEVSVDVLAYNSRAYYVITDGGGFGEQVVKLPCTGNETVLDAIANIEGLSEVSSKRIWVARPSLGTESAHVMDVNWREISQEGIVATNYQLLPGDRVYIAADSMIRFDNVVSKIVSPFERMFGFTLLGHGTVRALQFGHINRGGGNGGF